MEPGDDISPGRTKQGQEVAVLDPPLSLGIGSSPPVTGSSPVEGSGFTLKFLYLFAGTERQTSVAAYLREKCAALGWKVDILEIDLKRDSSNDLTRDSLQKTILGRVSQGEFDIVICTPPCSTWSRVRMANMRGPPPVRSRGHLWGFPWVRGRYAKDLELGNILVKFSIQIWLAVKIKPVSLQGFPIFLFGEHPEDLGLVIREEDGLRICPASIWQISDIRSLVDAIGSVIGTVAINQCCWGAPWRKPTRLLSSSQQVLQWGPNEWPQFDAEMRYTGPLSQNCQCQVRQSLVRRTTDEAFRTTGTDVYPPLLDEAIAGAIIAHFEPFSHASPYGRGKEEAMDQVEVSRVSPGEHEEEMARGSGLKSNLDEEETARGSGLKSNLDEEVEEEDKEVLELDPRQKMPGHGSPIKCYYKGSYRTIHDGGGLCSPGRWPVTQRSLVESKNGRHLGSMCKKLFLEWIQGQDKKQGGAQDVFWKLAAGRYKESPFQDSMGELRERLDKELKEMGFDPARKAEDRLTEVNFRRLKAMLEAVEDVDYDWLEEVAKEGVSLGVDETLPRVPRVFEEKVKWNLSPAEEDFRDVFADNYRSAEENEEDIKRQVLEEVEKGTILMKDKLEVEKEYEGRLAVAALGAVPKELGSSVVRIVHDGSYSVDVNHRIKVRDRMRFPSVDDASGVLSHLEDQVSEQKGGVRFSLLYDVSGAHKLLPVKKRDWGYQSFRLPGQEYKDKVFLHTRGTFGVASAAYWWQRLAACWVRLGHIVAGLELGVLHLLFADDGWLTSCGRFFWRGLIFWLFFMDLCEIPISWKKVRGGTQVHWIGYQIDVREFRKGISEKKVQWIKDWVDKHSVSGGVLGRDLKSALGRFSFVAGALHHVRPFLGPLFAWSAVLPQGAFSKFPDAVRVLLEYVKDQAGREAMTKPLRLRRGCREAFRVDAKAEGEKIVIGGWEIPEGNEQSKARWFSITLDRKSAPWAYVKGEPFRSIASLELTAVLVAVILFGERLVDTSCKNRLVLSAGTDNVSNTYVLKHFMSCKYPLSIVVMELALQLKKFNLELDLGWIPRGQNTAADALTNDEFEGFDMSKRIEVNFEDIEFLVLPKLMRLAGDLDEEIKMAKSSKEAKGDRPAESLPKNKRGQTRWEDPW